MERHLPRPFPSLSAIACGEDQYGCWQTLRLAGVEQRFRWIVPGSFVMGSPADEAGRGSGELQHQVTLTKGFWLAETACSQALWRAVTGDQPSSFEGDELPVEQASWNDIQQRFLPALANKQIDLIPTLPSEAQWEYACRAGTTTAFHWGERVKLDQANYSGRWDLGSKPTRESRKRTVDVYEFDPNPWGLYQMHGNVFEWCGDWYGAYQKGETVDPEGPVDGRSRVLRGGSWDAGGRYLRAAFRHHVEPAYRRVSLGFRLAQVPVE